MDIVSPWESTKNIPLKPSKYIELNLAVIFRNISKFKVIRDRLEAKLIDRAGIEDLRTNVRSKPFISFYSKKQTANSN